MKTQYTLRSLLLIGLLILLQAKAATCAEPPHSACDLDIIVPDDITICSAEDFDIDADINGDYLEFFWTQDGDFLTDSDLNPTVYIDGTTTFTLTAYQMDEENLIVNGDFESGDWIEYTDYYVGDGNCMSGLGYLACEGTYGVITDPSLGHNNFDPCPDHTGGGNMMVVNGASSFQQIWCQTIAVEPDGIYAFTAWATSVNPASPAQLQFAIDGTLIGNLFSLSGTTCQWEEFTAEWEASGQTSVEICITNQNTASGGNDFALDDISFHQICESSNSFTVTYAAFEVDWSTPEDIDCETMDSDIEIILDQDFDYDIEWDTEDGNIVTQQNDGTYILVDEPATYSVTITNEFGCEEDLNIEVEADTLSPQIMLAKSNDLNCQDQNAILVADALFGGIDISWYDSMGNFLLENDELEVSAAGWYIVEAYDDDNGCTAEDSIYVLQDTILAEVNFNLSNPLNCNFNSSVISLENSFSSVIWIYDNDTIAMDVDSVFIFEGGNYEAFVQGTNYCIDSAVINVPEEIPVFEYDLQFDSIIDCNNPESEFSIAFDSSIYLVSLEQSILVPDSLMHISNGGTYYIDISDSNGCTQLDSFSIIEDLISPTYNLSGDTISCQDPTALLLVQTQGGSVNWTTPSGQEIMMDSLETAVPGIYYVEVRGQNGCMSQDSIELTSSELIPELFILGDTLNCAQMSVDLLAQSNQTDLSYSWAFPDQSAAQTQMINTSQAGLYSLIVTNSVGCSAAAEYLILEDYSTPEIELIDSIFLDCNISSTTSNLNLLSPVDSLQWNGPGIISNDHNIDIDQEGLYVVEAFGKNGCSTSDTVQVTIDTLPPPLQILAVPTITCDQESVSPLIDIPDNISAYVWTGPNFNSTDSLVSLSEPGEYTIQLTGTNGCSHSGPFTVEIDTVAPPLNFSTTALTCTDTLIQVGIEETPDISSAAFIYAGDTLETIFSVSIEPFDNAAIMVTGQNGCQTSAPLVVEYDTLAVPIQAEASELNCQMDPIQITVNNNDDFTELNLAIGGSQIGDIFTYVNEPGLYEISGIADNGCLSETEIIIEAIEEAPQILSYNETRLECQDAILLDFIDIVDGTPPYNLTIDGVSYDSGAVPILIEGAGIHQIEVSDAYNCIDQTELQIVAITQIDLDLNPSISIQQGQQIQLELEILPDDNLVQSIQWFPSEFLSCDNCLMPTASPLEDIDYEVLVLDIYGCEARANISVDVNRIHKIYIPNIIALGDQRNDQFKFFFNSGDIKRVNFLNIYDRWGNLVYSIE
ncbi:MAG: hypothetical protein HKN09_04645, partial [Saprospiraceae bacterium]|nr:hypothetical protein [Saprospiraceae bacterium]